ncbi:MAG: hypothetical protein AB1750_20630 [Chloroflexota bacterium]
MAEKTEKKRERIPEETRQHARAAREEFRKGVEALMPESYREFHQHRKAARKEMLLAFRSLIDHAIKRAEEETEE